MEMDDSLNVPVVVHHHEGGDLVRLHEVESAGGGAVSPLGSYCPGLGAGPVSPLGS